MAQIPMQEHGDNPEFPWSSPFLEFLGIIKVATWLYAIYVPDHFIGGDMRGSCTEVIYISSLLIVKRILTKYSTRQGIAYDSFRNSLPYWIIPWVSFLLGLPSLALYPFTTSILHWGM